jgi:hypothetical protein
VDDPCLVENISSRESMASVYVGKRYTLFPTQVLLISFSRYVGFLWRRRRGDVEMWRTSCSSECIQEVWEWMLLNAAV